MTEDVEIQMLEKYDRVLGRNGLIYEVMEVKPFGEDETFMVLRSDDHTAIGSQVNGLIYKRML